MEQKPVIKGDKRFLGLAGWFTGAAIVLVVSGVAVIIAYRQVEERHRAEVRAQKKALDAARREARLARREAEEAARVAEDAALLAEALAAGCEDVPSYVEAKKRARRFLQAVKRASSYEKQLEGEYNRRQSDSELTGLLFPEKKRVSKALENPSEWNISAGRAAIDENAKARRAASTAFKRLIELPVAQVRKDFREHGLDITDDEAAWLLEPDCSLAKQVRFICGKLDSPPGEAETTSPTDMAAGEATTSQEVQSPELVEATSVESAEKPIPSAAEKTLWFRWAADVNGVDDLVIRRGRTSIRHIKWDPPPLRIRYRRLASLPRREGAAVSLRQIKGRGEVKVTQQPSRKNDYTAVIRIDDDKPPGADRYEFEVYYELPGAPGS